MNQILFIALGGSVGAVARYGLSSYVLGAVNEVFPWGTLVVNLSGSFLMGVFVEVFEQSIVPTNLRSLITIGFLGAFTTFSAFSMETVALLRDGEFRLATANVLLSNIAAIGLLIVGIYFTRVSMRFFS